MTEKRIYGLIGYPVKHSLSPAMHNDAFKYLKEKKEIDYDAEYRLFEIKPENLEGFLSAHITVEDVEGKSFLSKNIVGFNITIPYKVRALEYFVENITVVQNPEVVLSGVGSVNTVKREGGKIYYYNTDIKGFMRSLREDLKFDTRGKNVLIFGCGGAGRSIIAGLKGTDIGKIYIYDVNDKAVKFTKAHFDNFSEIKDKLEVTSEKQIAEKIKDADLLVNASPVGMKEGDGSVIDKKLLHKGLSVYDVVYNRETQLIKDAKSLGLNAINGLGMLLYQGMLSFEIWTGKKAPEDVMRRALCSHLA